MKPKDISVLLIGTAAVCAVVFLLSAAPAPVTRPGMQCFMCDKLDSSKAILEGLTLEKYDLVAKNALHLRNMTQSNLWYTSRQPDYMAHTTNFQKSVDALFTAAVSKNLDSASEAYLKMTRNCIDCHRLVRVEQHKVAVQKKPAK